MAHRDCVSKYGARLVTDGMLCANSTSEQPCKADSGGLLVTRSPEGSYSLAGIFSVGMIRSGHDNLGIFTNITAVSGWLADIVFE